MNKKTYIIVAILLMFLLGGLIAYYFVTPKDGTDNGGVVNTFKNFFPFGGDEVVTEERPVINENEGENNSGSASDFDITKKLRKLSSEPVSGAGTLDVKAGTVVRYIEKSTGHIFETELFSPRQGRISNTTIPKVYDAVWGNKNNSLIARYLKDDDVTIDTFSLTIKDTSTTTENTITGIPFPNKISDVSIYDNSVFFLEQAQSGSNGYIGNFSGGNKKLIWNSPIRELNSQYVNSNTVALNTKPEENTDGFLYFINTSNASYRKVLGNIKGLSSLVAPDATRVLYIKQGDDYTMNLYDLSKRTYTTVTPESFPEKCVWATKNIVYCAVPKEGLSSGSLTLWYKGMTQHTDDIWKYDLTNNTSEIIVDLRNEGGETIDVIKPLLSQNEQYLVFINKIDNSLWSLDLTK
jgi:hypothetical protein